MHERGVHVKTFGWQKFPVFLELSSLRPVVLLSRPVSPLDRS